MGSEPNPRNDWIESVINEAGEHVYALVREEGETVTAAELTVKRAIELQHEGVPYVVRAGGKRRHSDFTTYYH